MEEDGTVSEEVFSMDMPYLYGMAMQDGTKLNMLFGAGYEGYINKDSEEYGFGNATNRVLNPDDVAALVFVNPENTQEMIEVPLP